MNKFWVILYGVIISACLKPEKVLSALDVEKEIQIDNVIANIFMPQAHTPVGLGIVKSEGTNNDFLFAKGYGLRDVENLIEATNQTKYIIASITKTFTSTLIVKTLSEKYPQLGEFALDTPLKKLLPQSNFTFSDRYRSESMTFRDLISHRHCLETAGLGMSAGAFEDADELIYRTRYAEELCHFRTYAVYSNEMYTLLGKLVGELAGSSYETLLENLFLSLEMTSSTYVKPSVDYDRLQDMSQGYYRIDGTWHWGKMNSELYKRITFGLSAGGIISTPSDMAKYMRFHLNYGKVGNQQIVQEKAMKWLHTPAVSFSINPKENAYESTSGLYGLGTGFVLGLYDGWSFSRHDGDWSPFLSSMTLYPDVNLGIFTTCNGPGHLPEFSSLDHLHGSIFDILLGINRTSKVSRTVGGITTFTRKPTEVIKHYEVKEIDLPALAGVYGHPGEGDFEITYNPNDINGMLYLKYGKWATGYLRNINGTSVFKIDWDSDIVHVFYAAGADPDGYIDVAVNNTARFLFAGNGYDFIRNATLETLPEIPWSDSSCGPDTA